MALVIVYTEICARRNIPIYYKATNIDMKNLAVAGAIVVDTVTVM